ncbi:hypothetical protein EVAR_25173_1 [Eumeta japonica]|uniref:Uncharacterized protein n=1 Tax=Eumeta variegata TaxID=151549 RepID=A0A4C1VU38_EUMVA|nr:hypothetical protein EVAR_25173_1 [Eumeta japonica]
MRIYVNFNPCLILNSDAGYISNSNPDSTLGFDPNPVLNFGPGPVLYSDPGPVLDSSPRPVFNFNSATSHSSTLNKGGVFKFRSIEKPSATPHHRVFRRMSERPGGEGKKAHLNAFESEFDIKKKLLNPHLPKTSNAIAPVRPAARSLASTPRRKRIAVYAKNERMMNVMPFGLRASVPFRCVTGARRTASADWWIKPDTAGMRPRDLFTTSRDYRESVGAVNVKGIVPDERDEDAAYASMPFTGRDDRGLGAVTCQLPRLRPPC